MTDVVNKKKRKRKKPTRREQKFWHQKLVNMIPDDVIIGEQWAYRLFDDEYYSVRTLKAFCFAFAWLKENRQLLPEGRIRFHGNRFSVRDDFGVELALVGFSGYKFIHITLLNQLPKVIRITEANPVPSTWCKTI